MESVVSVELLVSVPELSVVLALVVSDVDAVEEPDPRDVVKVLV